MKVFLTIAVLFSHIYGSTAITEHGASALQFRKIVEEFTNSPRAVAYDRIPFENLSNGNIKNLKSAFHYTIHPSVNADRLAAVFPNETREIMAIQLEHHLNILSAIEEPRFAAVRNAASESLTTFSKPSLWTKPEHAPANKEQPHDPTNMVRWLADWRQVMQSLEGIIEEIRLAN